jgi:hypothetical protein
MDSLKLEAFFPTSISPTIPADSFPNKHLQNTSKCQHQKNKDSPK